LQNRIEIEILGLTLHFERLFARVTQSYGFVNMQYFLEGKLAVFVLGLNIKSFDAFRSTIMHIKIKKDELAIGLIILKMVLANGDF
jgi:hypothetical protein